MSAVRCPKCGWEGPEEDLGWVETFPGRMYEDRYGNPPEPPEGEAKCPQCGASENYLEDVA